jgi:hypothetical protein
MSMRRVISLVEAKNNVGLSAESWSIYKPYEDEDDTDSEYAGYRIVASALNDSASKAAAEVSKKVAALIQSSELDEKGLAIEIIGLVAEASKKFLSPVYDKYGKFGVGDSEVTDQWDNLVTDHAILAVPFAFRKSLKNRIRYLR